MFSARLDIRQEGKKELKDYNTLILQDRMGGAGGNGRGGEGNWFGKFCSVYFNCREYEIFV